MTNQLEKYFKGKGEVNIYNFKQIENNGYAYIYELTSDEHKQIHYEVFEHRINKQFDCVSYPKSKAFGIWAFSVNSYDKALLRYKELTERVIKRIENRESDE